MINLYGLLFACFVEGYMLFITELHCSQFLPTPQQDTIVVLVYALGYNAQSKDRCRQIH